LINIRSSDENAVSKKLGKSKPLVHDDHFDQVRQNELGRFPLAKKSKSKSRTIPKSRYLRVDHWNRVLDHWSKTQFLF